MVEIVTGTLQFIQLPENHIIKVFCRQHKITGTDTQENLMKLINKCICLYFSEMTEEVVSTPIEEILVEETNKRAEEL